MIFICIFAGCWQQATWFLVGDWAAQRACWPVSGSSAHVSQRNCHWPESGHVCQVLAGGWRTVLSAVWHGLSRCQEIDLPGNARFPGKLLPVWGCLSDHHSISPPGMCAQHDVVPNIGSLLYSLSTSVTQQYNSYSRQFEYLNNCKNTLQNSPHHHQIPTRNPGSTVPMQLGDRTFWGSTVKLSPQSPRRGAISSQRHDFSCNPLLEGFKAPGMGTQ